MMDPSLLWGALIVLCAGLYVGSRIEARRWRANAGDYRRIESAGRLYRVVDDGSEAEYRKETA
jgi:hypothetical protein